MSIERPQLEEQHEPQAELKNENLEKATENPMDSVVELPEHSREYIDRIVQKANDVFSGVEGLRQFKNKNKIENLTADNLGPDGNILRSNIRTGLSSLMRDLGYQFYRYSTLATGEFGESGERPLNTHLDETAELAWLANDTDFREKLKIVRLFIKENPILSSSIEKSNLKKLSGMGMWQDFLSQFDKIPGDKKTLEKWLLKPVRRFSHSIFTHVTSDKALSGILENKELRSATLVEDPTKTGAAAAKHGLGANMIFFDQNSISPNYGEMGTEDPGHNVKRLWFGIRGDRLIANGLSGDRHTFMRTHPFTGFHDVAGEPILSNDFEARNGTAIPDEELMVVVATDDRESLDSVKAGQFADAATYDPKYYDPDKPDKVSIDVIKDLNSRAKIVWGEVQDSNLAVSLINKKMPGYNFPILLPLKKSSGDVSKNSGNK